MTPGISHRDISLMRLMQRVTPPTSGTTTVKSTESRGVLPHCMALRSYAANSSMVRGANLRMEMNTAF